MADMESYAKNCKSTVIPGLRYENALAMIDWLCDTFGFEKQAVYANPDGTVMHSQLTFGNGMIMIGSATNSTPASALMKQPNEIGGPRHRPHRSSLPTAMPSAPKQRLTARKS